MQGSLEANDFSEENLIPRAARGDVDAFNILVITYQDLAYNHALVLLRDEEIAADVTQDSFIKAFRAIGTFRNGSFRAWLLRIVTNTAYDSLRQLHRQPTQPLFPDDEEGEDMESPFWLADPDLSVQSRVERNEETLHLMQMVAELPELYRSVITLVDVYELDYGEVSRTLGIPLGTVKSRLTRARLQMRNKLLREQSFPAQTNYLEARAGW